MAILDAVATEGSLREIKAEVAHLTDVVKTLLEAVNDILEEMRALRAQT